MRFLDRRILIGAVVTAAVLGAAALGLSSCGPKGGAATAEDMTMGNPKAPVTLVEYASVACPHCARFNNAVFPDFKKKYIDTGKVYYVSREMLTGDPRLAAAGFLLARCAGKDKYFAVTDAIYRRQEEMYAGDARGVLLSIAKSVGISDSAFDKCITDESALNALNDRVSKYADAKINSTPTFVVGDQRIEGEVTLSQLDDLVAGKKMPKPADE